MSRDELVVLVRCQDGQITAQAGQIAELMEANEALASRLAKLEHLLSCNSGRELDLDLAHAAIDAELDACYEAALLGGQEVGGGGHFLGLSHSGERND
jgi:hypothetical protein